MNDGHLCEKGVMLRLLVIFLNFCLLAIPAICAEPSGVTATNRASDGHLRYVSALHPAVVPQFWPLSRDVSAGYDKQGLVDSLPGKTLLKIGFAVYGDPNSRAVAMAWNSAMSKVLFVDRNRDQRFDTEKERVLRDSDTGDWILELEAERVLGAS